jgi:formylglycine-generating enzyme required for sulfatase activity
MLSLEELYQRLQALEARMESAGLTEAPSGMVLVPAGSFVMGAATNVGQESASADETPQHAVSVSAFYIESNEVSKEQWDGVYDWATEHGYGFSPGCGQGKAGTHPVDFVTWHDCVKWCNARSEMAGLAACYTVSGEVYRAGEYAPDCDFRARGYRLPTEAEWEKAARGGLSNRRFPWGDTSTIQHARANYNSDGIDSFDTSPTTGFHPSYSVGAEPYTSPVGSFGANGYGLCDMAGNVSEWCWDWYAADYYAQSPAADPTGPAVGAARTARGGSWVASALLCRIPHRVNSDPAIKGDNCGFRCVRSAGR